MAYFSFLSLDNSFTYSSKQIVPNQKYYSKDITLWKELNNRNKKKYSYEIKYENRSKINFIGKKILICLPPRFGLGDAIEYSIAIKSIIVSKKFKDVGIAFCSDHLYIFKNLFKFSNVYPLLISEKQMSKYDTVFHITLEIESLKYQKYKRSNIAIEICNFFEVPFCDYKASNKKQTNINSKKISIFPVSTSTIRSLPNKVIQELVNNFKNKYEIEVFIDNSSFSKHLQELNKKTNILFIKPNNVDKLISYISKISFGVFVDSGPLHIAKIFDKKGIFVETSVSSKVLLSNSKKIEVINNNYTSNYCSGPCGLVDIFSLENNIGCYETNKTNFEKIKHLKNLQRWNKEEKNSQFILNPVGCIEKIDIESIINSINIKLKEF